MVPSPGELPWGTCFAPYVGRLLSVPMARLCQEPSFSIRGGEGSGVQICRTEQVIARISHWSKAVHLSLESALGQDTHIPNLELQLVGKSASQPDPLTSPISFLFQYDYLGDRRPVPAGLYPYNYPPPPTVHDKMVRPLLPHTPLRTAPPSREGSLPPAWPMWLLVASGYLLPPSQDSDPRKVWCQLSLPCDTGQRRKDRSGTL